MDPTTCYLDMLTAMNDGHWQTARELALSLRDWLEEGRSYPPHYPQDEVAAYLASVLRRTVCVAW